KNTGNRGADSDGCTETQCACTDPATGSDPNRIWIADWAGSFPCFGPVPQEPLIPSEYGRSADVRRSLVADACGYRYRLLCACAASERGGSAGGAALGIKPGSSVVCERRGRSCQLEGIVLTNLSLTLKCKFFLSQLDSFFAYVLPNELRPRHVLFS